jgi:peptidoglycan/xylan/chitin deacetylase (PgdA/CDA1 family)
MFPMTMRNKIAVIMILCLLSIVTTADGTIRRIRVPILMYHYVSPLPPDADSIREGLTLSPEFFEQHMEYLSEEGYTTISLYEINEALENGSQLPSKPIILTFDDSYTDHYNYVFPILKEHDFIGTFFVITQFTDDGNPNHLTWEQIEEMSQAGMNMESHTKTHNTLIDRSYDFLVWEIIGSIESLESHTGMRPEVFSYPVGKYDDTTLNFLETTTIKRAVTTEYGTYHTLHDAILSPRLRITSNMGVSGLKNLLQSAP